MSKRIVPTAVLAGLLVLGTGSAPAWALSGEKVASVQEAISFDPKADHAQAGDTLFWVNQPGGAKGVTRVIIPFFQIQFVQDAQANATGGSGAHSKTAVQLEGPTPAQMQAMTDELYATFVTDLKAAGLQVVTPDEAKTYTAYNEIMKAARPSGQEVKGTNGIRSQFYAPTGMNYYFLPTMLPDLAGGGSMTAMSNVQIVRREADLMSEANAAVVGFRAVVDFATLSASKRRLFYAKAKTSAEFGLVIRPLGTQVFLITPNAKATMIDPSSRMRLELQAPLEIDSDAILSADDNRTTGQKRGEAAGLALSFLTGTGQQKSRSYAVKVDPSVWEQDVKGALRGVSAAATAKLKSGLR